MEIAGSQGSFFNFLILNVRIGIAQKNCNFFAPRYIRFFTNNQYEVILEQK